MLVLGGAAGQPVKGYLTGGATAVLMGWRASTIDVDVRFEPESDEILRAIPKLKEDLHLNVELASPLDFIPVAPDWQQRSEFIAVHGNVSFFHFDVYAQLLAKVERGHDQDVADIDEMFRRGLVDPNKLAGYFEIIAPSLYRYPALDEAVFRESVEKVVRGHR